MGRGDAGGAGHRGGGDHQHGARDGEDSHGTGHADPVSSIMTPKLRKPLRREVQLGGQPYIVTLSQKGVRILPKGARTGAREISWLDLVSGEIGLYRRLVRLLAHRKPPHAVSRPAKHRRRRRDATAAA